MGRKIGRFEVSSRMRVIVDNDFSGDPDDLFQMAHHLLSPSVEIRGIIGSHLRPDDPSDPSGRSAANAAKRAGELLEVMGLAGSVPVHEGAPVALSDTRTPIPSAAAEAIVAEAMRGDTDLPLYLACGAGLTDAASALLMEPRVAERLILVWIGGNEHPGLATPSPRASLVEYNLNIDIDAACAVFNDSSVPLWQVPRDAYRQCLVSYAELEARVAPSGELGRFLVDSIAAVAEGWGRKDRNLGEAYVLGDSPLVLLTALQCSFQPDSSSSRYALMDRPSLLPDGGYGPPADCVQPASRGKIRVYTRIDTRLMFEDMFAKLAGRA
jgi:purine nucleosidase